MSSGRKEHFTGSKYLSFQDTWRDDVTTPTRLIIGQKIELKNFVKL